MCKFHDVGNEAGLVAKPVLRRDRDRDASVGEHRNVEGVVAERGVEEPLPDALSQANDLTQGIGNGPFDVRDHDPSLVARPRRDDVGLLETGFGPGGDDDVEGRGADENDLDARVSGTFHQAYDVGVQPCGQLAVVDHAAREGLDFRTRPARKAKGHDLADPFFGKLAAEVRFENSLRDLGPASRIGKTVIACLASNRVDPRGFPPSTVQESAKELFADVPLPESPIAVGRDDAAGSLAGQGLDTCPYGVRRLKLHVASIPTSLRRAKGRSSMRIRIDGGGFLLAVGMSLGVCSLAPRVEAQGTRGVRPSTPPPSSADPAPTASPDMGPTPSQSGGPASPSPDGDVDSAPVEVPNDLVRAHAGGLTATEVGTRAMRTSWTAKASEQALVAAAARVDQAWASFLPRLSGVGKYTYLSPLTPPNFAPGEFLLATKTPPPPGGGPYMPAPPLEGFSLTIPIVQSNWLFQGTIVVPISDYFIRIDQNYTAATRSQDAARWDLVGARATADADGRVAYYTWLRARGAVIVAVQALNDQRTHLRDARNQFSVGNASRADTLRAETSVSSAELALEQAKNLADLAEKQMRVAIHVADEVVVTPGEDLETALTPIQGDLRAMIAEALGARPEVKSAEANAESAQKVLAVAKAGLYPSLSAFADGIVGNPNPRLFPPTQTWFPSWDVGGQVTWALNDALVANGVSSEDEARLGQIVANKFNVRDGIEIEVTQAFQNVQQADFGIQSSTRELASAQEAYRVQRELFNNGRGTSTTLTDAETDLTRARLDLLNAKVDARTARVRLEHALGRDAQAR
jgi:outer membrane protein TolC